MEPTPGKPVATLARGRGEALSGEALLRWLPTPLVLLGVVQVIILASFAAARGLIDTDYFWHLETGRLIATSGALPSKDPFSLTYRGPWTLHEWLGQLLLYRLVEAVGEAATSALFGALAALPFVLLAFVLSRRGVQLLPIALASSIGIWVTAAYAMLRPQVLSWILLAALVALLLALRPDRPARILLFVPLFLLWSNLHGLYVVGLGVLGLYALFTLVGATPMRRARLQQLVALGLAFAASALTPAGPAGLAYPLRYVDAGDWGLAHISEWQSPDFHQAGSLGLLALILAVVAIGRRGVAAWQTGLAVLGVVMALVAVRNGPLAAVLAMPALAVALDARVSAIVRRSELPVGERVGRRLIELGAALVVLAASVLAIPRLAGGGVVGEVPDYFPVTGADRLAEVRPDARVLGEYSWGGYLIHRLYASGGRVFVDGRNDMYGDEILNDYTRVVTADAGWDEVLERYRVDAILLPPDKALVRGPAQAEGWCEAYRDEVQVLLLRDCSDG